MRASAPLTPAFLSDFKAAIHRSDKPSFFSALDDDDDTAEDGISSAQRPSQQELHYPVAMFKSLSELPSRHDLEGLLNLFESQFRSRVPFLCDMQLLSNPLSNAPSQSSKRAPFIVFAMATVGAMMTREADLNEWGSKMWQITSRVHSSSCELDNRMARRTDWVVAVCVRNVSQTCQPCC